MTITNECNLKCVYCYQENDNKRVSGCISDDTINRFIEYLLANPNNTTVSFYGGEPLLYAQRCIEISNRLKSTQSSIKKKYRASITTNGTLLTGQLAEQLKLSGIDQAQVTIDGPEEIHDRMRPYRDGKGSYNKIVKNIEDASKHLRILVRVNVCKETSTYPVDYLRTLSSISNNIKVYVAPI